MFAPTLELVQEEQAFLTENPADILREGRAHRVPLITGYNAEEGLVGSTCKMSQGITRITHILRTPTTDTINNTYILLDLIGNEEIRRHLNDEYLEAMPAYMQFDTSIGQDRVQEILSQARDFYFGPGERIDGIEKIQNFTNIVTGMSTINLFSYPNWCLIGA